VRTDDLIAVLSSAQPERPGPSLGLALAGTSVFGLALSLALVALSIGVRADMATAFAMPKVWIKHIGLTAILFTGLLAFVASLRPGRKARPIFTFVVVPVLAIAAVAVWQLALMPASEWRGAVMGTTWAYCLVLVPSFAILPFALLVALGQRGAPVDPGFAGAMAGFAAGALSASAYAIHCHEDAAAFVLIWYGLGIVACTLIGRLLGPRLLRW
jgi:hypothetical protein